MVGWLPRLLIVEKNVGFIGRLLQVVAQISLFLYDLAIVCTVHLSQLTRTACHRGDMAVVASALQQSHWHGTVEINRIHWSLMDRECTAGLN